ncbi:MAG: hypothetical protein Q4D87_01360 [Actinomycetaceae bacterium]|nr:hypothetical protein [Actinomycetaceae bacterium]
MSDELRGDNSAEFNDILDESDVPTRSEPIDDVYGPSTVIAALDQIEDLVEIARALPMSASVLVNKAEILDLLEQARQALPDDLVAADAVVADADAVMGRADTAAETTIQEANARAQDIVEQARANADELAQRSREDAEVVRERASAEAEHMVSSARAQAEEIVEAARAQAEEMIEQENVSIQARQRAEEIVRSAHEKAVELADGADRYCAESLETLAIALDRIAHQTHAGQDAIEARQEARREGR